MAAAAHAEVIANWDMRAITEKLIASYREALRRNCVSDGELAEVENGRLDHGASSKNTGRLRRTTVEPCDATAVLI